MRRLVLRVALFCVPFACYALFILAVDPFDFFHGPKIIPTEVKARASYPLNQSLQIFSRFRDDPAPNLLLGDSRMLAFKTGFVSRLTGERYGSLAMGGASLKEDLEAFRFADRHIRLSKVYLALAYDTYNDYRVDDRTRTFVTFEANPALYVFNRTVFQAALNSVYSHWTGIDPKIGVPAMSKEQYWQYVLEGPETQRMLRTYIEPVRYRQELVRLAEHCRRNNIQLTFVVFPTHVEMQRRIGKSAPNAEERWRRDVATIAPLLDFDYPNSFTENRDNFSDPLHASRLEQIAAVIWRREPGLVRRRTPTAPTGGE